MTERLPQGERAIIDIRKLADYCVSKTHPRGRNKARVFQAALGLGRGDAAWLRDVLLAAATVNEAEYAATDAWGEQWRLDAPVEWRDRRATVRTVWVVRTGEMSPRFVTAWALE